jgi:outer membrane protein
MKVVHSIHLFILAFIVPLSTSYAQDEPRFTVGLAYIGGTSIYSNVDTTSRIMPSLSYESDSIRISVKEGLTYKFIDTASTAFDASLAISFKPYKSTDSTILAGMDRDMSVDGALSGSYGLARGLTSTVTLATEISGKYNGSSADVSISQFIPVYGLPFIFRIGSKWLDKNRAKYFYGVYADEATVARFQYDPGNVLLPYLSVNTFYKLTPSTSLFANINTKFLSKKVTNSPIVSEETSTNIIVGIGYTFH